MRSFAIRVANEIDARGVLDVLRYGVKDRGVQVDLCYFRPGLPLAKDALREYNLNVVTRGTGAALLAAGQGRLG